MVEFKVNDKVLYNNNEYVIIEFDDDRGVFLSGFRWVCSTELTLITKPKEEINMNTNTKPFNLEEAIAGAPMVTRDGRKAVFLAYDEELDRKIICKVYDDYTEAETFLDDGKYFKDRSESRYDLFMATQKKTVWVNFYSEGSCYYFNTECEADFMKSEIFDRIGGKAYPVEIDV